MVVYATADDVRRVLQTVTFTGTTTPTDTDVEAFIEEGEDEIDRRTRRAWRVVTITEEFQDVIRGADPSLDRSYYNADTRIFLDFSNTKKLDSGQGDKLELWNGNAYEDFLVDRTEGRENDFWQDEKMGVIMVKLFYGFYRRRKARITYRYGEDAVVPKDIRKATALLAAIEIIGNDDRTGLLTDTGDLDRVNFQQRIENMQKQVDRIIEGYAEGFTI